MINSKSRKTTNQASSLTTDDKLSDIAASTTPSIAVKATWSSVFIFILQSMVFVALGTGQPLKSMQCEETSSDNEADIITITALRDFRAVYSASSLKFRLLDNADDANEH